MLNELQKKYPGYAVRYLPLSDCPVCQGVGEFKNGLGNIHVCACVCIGGPDTLRKLMVTILQETTQDLLKKVYRMGRRKEDSVF